MILIINKIKTLNLTALLVSSITMALSGGFVSAATQADYNQAIKAQQMLPQLELSSINNRQQSVTYSRSVNSKAIGLNQRVAPSVKSQQYTMRVTGEQLKKGVSIATSSAGSLVKISPAGGSNAKAIPVEELQIITPSGRKLTATQAMGFKANSKDLQSTPFPQGTSVFKFEKSLGAGQFKMITTQSVASDQDYMVTVLEKESPYRLGLKASQDQFFAGQNFVAEVNLSNLHTSKATIKTHLNQLQAKIVSPDGNEYPVKFSANKQGGYQINMPMNLPLTAEQGLWEVQVTTEGKAGQLIVKRDARLAFAYSPVTAIVEDISAAKRGNKGAIQSNVKVAVQYAGRYEVKATLYSQIKGRLTPVMEARTAQWLEIGDNEMLLSFDKAAVQIKARGGNRYVVKNVVLTDQSRMSIFPQEDKLSHIAPRRTIIDKPLANNESVIRKKSEMGLVEEKLMIAN